jgi:squalene synthase HpnC
MTSDRSAPAAAMPAAGRVADEFAAEGSWLSDAGRQAPAKAGGENFPVALRLLPARHRRHLMAVYAFARTADDAGDLAPADQRLDLLAELARDVTRLYARREAGSATGGAGGFGGAGEPGGAGDPGEPRLAAVRGLAGLVADCAVPMQLFLDLIQAGVQDQNVTRYETFDDLVGYCRLSANPVGRIVLYVFGAFSPRRAELSDSICTGLQLAEHLQDVGEDMRAGRVYLPAEDLRGYGCTEEELRAGTAAPALRRLIAFEVGRARALIDVGAPLVGTLRGTARAAVAGYVAGGRAALAAIAASGHDVLSATPRPGKGRTAAELITTYVRAR